MGGQADGGGSRKKIQAKQTGKMKDLLAILKASRVYDLGQPYFVGMPHYPTHPPFLYGLTKKHGDFVAAGGLSSAADSISFGGHVGTHIDGLNHFSCGGKLFGGVDVTGVQTYGGGVNHHAVEEIQPILRRGVLLDIPALENTSALPADFVITPEHLECALDRQKIQIGTGDVVLLRTGWAQFYEDAARFVNETKSPGPELAGAQWLSARKIFAAGSDTVPFERSPDSAMPVHKHLLVEAGIHIMEVLNLEELARDRVYEFVFIAAPMKIRGGTGGPMRPLAIAAT
jgi:kynurenine formamidase